MNVSPGCQPPTWVVKVVLAPHSLGLLVRAQDPVEAVLADDGHLPLAVVHLVLPQQLHDLTAHCGLLRGEAHRWYWVITLHMFLLH